MISSKGKGKEVVGLTHLDSYLLVIEVG